MALALSGYSDTQIQKMGIRKGSSFKEYINKDLACYSGGMSKDTKRSFGFVNISEGANRDVLVYVTNTTMVTDYNTIASAKATNSTIYINPHGKTMKWCDEKMVKWRNGETTINKWQYSEPTDK